MKCKAPDPPKLDIFDLRVYLGLLMSNETVRGDIIVLSINLESELDTFLAGYFAIGVKKWELANNILSKVTSSQKIDILKNCSFKPSSKSFTELIKTYSGLNRLRNHAAHASWGDGHKIYRLADNEFIRKFVENYPASTTITARRVRRLFSALKRSKAYQQDEYAEDYIPF